MPDRVELAIAAALLILGMLGGLFVLEVTEVSCRKRTQSQCAAAGYSPGECDSIADHRCGGE